MERAPVDRVSVEKVLETLF
jgi:hypothetical protein